MSTATGAAGARASFSDWVAVMAGIIGAFMATLDISVTNSSLPQIQGEIGANGTEGTWITTAYLVAEIVMIPLTAWLTRVLGLRLLLVISTLAFVFFSVVCGVSETLTEMIIGRVGQGFFGGALLPTAMTIIGTRLPVHQQPQGLALFGITVVLAPVFGPLLGGWLTENVSWHFLFLLNVPVGALLVVMLLVGLPREPTRMGDLLKADWLGVVGLTVCLGTLTVVLEEGQRERWLESAHIVRLLAASAAGLLLVVLSQVYSRDPVLKLSLLRLPSFAAACLLSVVMGGAFFTGVYVIPVFLAQIAGYNAQEAGVVAMYSGASAMVMIPAVPYMLRTFDIRLLVGTGVVLYASASWLDIGLTAASAGDGFIWSQILRGISQVLIFMPLSQGALAGFKPEESADASALFNVARNLGASIGLALTAMAVDTRFAFHRHELAQSLRWQNFEADGGMASLFSEHSPDVAHAGAQALASLSALIGREALVMTYGDCFFIFGVAIMMTLPLVLLLRPAEGGTPMMH